MSRNKMLLGLGLILLLTALAAQSFSQGRGRGRAAAQGQFAQRDPEQMRQMMQQRMLQQIKQALAPTDAQWTTIEPALKKVMDLSQQTQSMGMGMGGPMGGRRPMQGQGGPGGPGGPGGGPGGPENMAEPPTPQPQTKIDKARLELRTALNGNETETETIQKKLEAFRTARTEAQKELAVAKDALKKTVTLNQEAELVLMGYLE